jgi:hypothetical protein
MASMLGDEHAFPDRLRESQSEVPSVPGWVEVYLAVLAPSKICGFQERIMRSLVLQLSIESAHSDRSRKVVF